MELGIGRWGLVGFFRLGALLSIKCILFSAILPRVEVEMKNLHPNPTMSLALSELPLRITVEASSL